VQIANEARQKREYRIEWAETNINAIIKKYMVEKQKIKITYLHRLWANTRISMQISILLQKKNLNSYSFVKKTQLRYAVKYNGHLNSPTMVADNKNLHITHVKKLT